MRRPLLIGTAVSAAALLAGLAGFAFLVGHQAYDDGSVGIEAKVPAGSWLTTGDASITNPSHHFAMRIESVRPNTGPGLEVTGAHVYLFPEPAPHLALGTVPGWPPRDPDSREASYTAYLRAIPSLPVRVTIPPGREAQIVFGMRSHARPGTTVWLRGVDVSFRRNWMAYRERVGYTATLHTVAAS